MRLKLLLVSLLMFSGMLYAQDTIKSLVISEARPAEARYTYVELTNMGTTTLDLHDFEFGAIGPWTDHYLPDDNGWIMIGDYVDTYVPRSVDKLMLGPGESFWMSVAFDFAKERHEMDPLQFGLPPDLPEQWNADIVFHEYEAPSGPNDSISVNWQIMERWNGRDCWYVRYHLPNGDSAVIDQVGGVWDGDIGANGEGHNIPKAYDVAGFTDATNRAVLVRKFTIKKGNLDFANGRGLSNDDSEWMPIPLQRNWTTWSQGRKMYWTVGNHGDYNLDETTLTSSTIDIDWTNHILNVPWGVHNKDSVMMQFDYHPGLAWNYQLNTDTVGGPNWEQAHMDSSYISARTGDTLTVWACGNDLDEIKFRINLLAPTDDANVIVPRSRPDDDGVFGDWHGPVFRVTNGVPGGDTIIDVPFATRTDTILKYFEKAPDASWEFVFVDGNERPDVKNGDLLRVTAKDNSVKDYFIDVQPYNPNHNADLTSITWPDIPSYYKGVFGYKGDTIPNFSPQLFAYKAIVPSDVNEIPALVAKSRDLNAKLEVERAVNLYGSTADQTVTFTSTAEDDTTVLVYTVQLVKERKSENIQKWVAEPFVSQYVFQDQWSNGFIEICNPGTEPIDLSNYMVMNQWNADPVSIITWSSGENDWGDRYVKYIPGYKWVSEADWAVTPGYCEQDLNVNPIVLPGDVFVMGAIQGSGTADGYAAPGEWWVYDQLDIDFKHNPWGEASGTSIGTVWSNGSWFMYKILNDSIQRGLKAADDPEDFECIEAWARPEGGDWVVGGRGVNADNQTVTYIRKPQYYQGNPVPGGSFGTTVLDEGNKFQDGTSEWYCYDRNYGIIQNYNWPFDILYITTDLGTHYMYEVTIYLSTVSSLAYKVTQGYSMNEQIRGLVTGVKVSDFFAKLSKKDEGQTLTVLSGGDPLANNAVVSNGDSLLVMSADSSNFTRYLLEVTDDGLSSDAVLTSTTYTVDHSGNTGTVSGFDYGTLLKNVKAGVTVPAGASMDIVDNNGAYVALKKLNYDTVYVETQVSDLIYFVVTAEDGATMITYQLVPNSENSDAFVVSEIYDVDSENFLISLIPENTAVSGFLKNLTPSAGATLQVKDKGGNDRNLGDLYSDDKLTVTAADGETENSYFIAFMDTDPDYLAYVTSKVYIVDQNELMIMGNPVTDVNEKTLASAFKSNLKAAPGATMSILDADMNVKEGDDDMDQGDMVMVVAGNGITITYYDVNVDPSSARDEVGNGISVYPNPSSGIINVSGLETGNRIQVYNSLGALVLDNVVVNTTEVISLEDQNQGFYFMTIRNKAGLVGIYKLIVE